MTFAASEDQLPRRIRPGGNTETESFPLPYSEGAAVGYKWFDKNNLQPLFPFGHGLSYTTFSYGKSLATEADNDTIDAMVQVTNTGRVAGMDVVQFYVSPVAGGWEAPKRLGAWGKIALAPGQSGIVSQNIDPRLLATFDQASQQWRIAPGQYKIMIGSSSRDIQTAVTVTLPGLTLPSNWRPGLAESAPIPRRGERGR